MKVILLKFVKGLGKQGDVIEVSDGYANNALFPKKLAKQATAAVLNKHKMAQKSASLQAEKEKQNTLAKLQKLSNKKITFKEKLNPKGTLYHALGLKEIIRGIYDEYKISIPNTLFLQKYSFKEKGEFTITLFAYDTEVDLIISITE